MPQELEIHSGQVDIMSSELLRAFLYERYAHTQDHTSSSRLIDHAINTHFHPEISDVASKLRDDATRLRHANH